MGDSKTYNLKQTRVGSPLKTYRGSVIKRSSKYGVGKDIGGSTYVAFEYAYKVVPRRLILLYTSEMRQIVIVRKFLVNVSKYFRILHIFLFYRN